MIDFKDKIYFVTGSTDGMGKETAIKLLNSGATVIIHGRNKKKGDLTKKEIQDITNSDKISVVNGDLGDFDQIKLMVKNIYENYDRLDVLINNAGVFRTERSITKEGLEETFAINYVAPFYLTNLLIKMLKKSNSARIVNVASVIQTSHVNLEELRFDNGYTATKAYAFSKSCLIMFTYLLAEKLKQFNISVNCLHPGIIQTKILDEAMGTSIGKPPEKGADAILYVATKKELEDVTGKYFSDNKEAISKKITYDRDLQEKLWKKTEEIIGENFNYFS